MTQNKFVIHYILVGFGALIYSCNLNKNKKSKEELNVNEKVYPIDTIKSLTKSPVDSVILFDISAEKLTADYVANEVKADHDYKDKEILVIGEVTDIKKGVAGDIYVVLKGCEKHRSVQCYYADEKDAETLKKGMTVAFKGRCDGLWVNVIINNCKRMFEKIQ